MKHLLSCSTVLSALLLGTISGCGGPPPQAATTPPPKSSAPPVVRKDTVYAERPLTRAKIMLMTDFALAPPMGNRYDAHRAFPLPAGAAGFLDASGSRAVATLAEVKRIDGPKKLQNLCVSKNGKMTVALSPEQGDASVLWLADSFEGPMRRVGSYLEEIKRPEEMERPAWIVADEKDTSLVDCESGEVERLAPAASRVNSLHWTNAIQVLYLRFSKPESSHCLLRTRQNKNWVKHPACEIRPREDGSLSIEAIPPRRSRIPQKCSFVLDAQGNKKTCDVPVGPSKDLRSFEREEQGPLFQLARFYAESKIVVPGPDGALFRLGRTMDRDPADRIGSTSLQACTPLLPTMPVFRCIAGKREVIVHIDSSGQIHEELNRKPVGARGDAITGQGDAAGVFHVTSDGGIAVGGDCKGNLGNVACVRGATGVWHDVPFSDELVTALNRTAPATRLVPTPDGRLFVGTATTDALLGGSVQIFIFRANQGSGITIENIPAWILGSLAGMSMSAYRGSSEEHAVVPSLAWSSEQRVRVWPLEREHPAFRTKEACRVDLALDGTFDTHCVQGRLFAVGRLGLWEKGPGEFYETLDAGQSWVPVPMPKGVETDDTVCSALGCRIGPYWRMGWGG